jgi:lysozyme
VKQGDVISTELAEKLLADEVCLKGIKVNAAISSVHLTQHQFNALVSFAYNLGTGALLRSTLMKRVLLNAMDPAIRQCFLSWDKGHLHGKVVTIPGLAIRRKAEADLYFLN